MKSIKLFVVGLASVLLAASAGLTAGCGGGDKGAPATTEAAGKAPAGTAPTKDEVAKIDCEKACTVQKECYEKGGNKLQTEDTRKTCVSGCKLAVSVYDSVKHGTTMARFVRYAAGECR